MKKERKNSNYFWVKDAGGAEPGPVTQLDYVWNSSCWCVVCSMGTQKWRKFLLVCTISVTVISTTFRSPISNFILHAFRDCQITVLT